MVNNSATGNSRFPTPSRRFPEGFLWGSATSAHQVEGGNFNDWSEWEKANAERLAKESGARFSPKNYISGAATDHYNRFSDDFNIAQALNQNAHRFSIEWSRIEPEEGKFNESEIEHYRNVISALRDRGIEPFVTLWHWTLPLWVRDIGGFENKKTIEYFKRYVEKITSELSDIKFWITINEPIVYSWNSYKKGEWPPNKQNFLSTLNVIQNLITAHRSAYNIIHSVNSRSQVGIAKNNMDYDIHKIFGLIVNFHRSLFWNHYFLKKIKKHQDFIGLNYYFHKHLSFNKEKEISDLGWEIYPEGIYHVLKDLKRYKKPIYITENGLADARDINREKFIKEHLRWVHRAITEGVDVKGYFYWSLLDNFEWDKGFWPKFGLVQVNYKTLERTIRPSAHEYAKICKDNKLIM